MQRPGTPKASLDASLGIVIENYRGEKLFACFAAMGSKYGIGDGEPVVFDDGLEALVEQNVGPIFNLRRRVNEKMKQ